MNRKAPRTIEKKRRPLPMSEELTQKIKTNLSINRRLCLKATHIISDLINFIFFFTFV